MLAGEKHQLSESSMKLVFRSISFCSYFMDTDVSTHRYFIYALVSHRTFSDFLVAITVLFTVNLLNKIVFIHKFSNNPHHQISGESLDTKSSRIVGVYLKVVKKFTKFARK